MKKRDRWEKIEIGREMRKRAEEREGDEEEE